MKQTNKLVEFQPTKKLFIETLTKDINIHDCIFELLDNAVDSFARHKLKDRRIIQLKHHNNQIEIYDNCGGISEDQLLKQVFRFGFTEGNLDFPSIGMYGIGLKRAIFKLGRSIVFQTDDGKKFCQLNIDVRKWLDEGDEKWDIPLAENAHSHLKHDELPYTRILINDLYDETREVLTSKFFEDLKLDISIYYTRFIERSLDIFINDEKQQPFVISAKIPPNLKPTRFEDKHVGINILIICWVEQRKKGIVEKGRFGWNIFMNDRLILHDNIGPESGWTGNRGDLPKWHQIFYDFRGVVFLTANDPSKLPLNTRKNGFNLEHSAYVYILRKMVEIAKPITKYLEMKYNTAKKDINESISKFEDVGDETATATIPIPIDNIPKKSKFLAPALERKTKSKEIIISYRKPEKKVAQLKRVLKVESDAMVGSKSFDYCYDILGGDSDAE